MLNFVVLINNSSVISIEPQFAKITHLIPPIIIRLPMLILQEEVTSS